MSMVSALDFLLSVYNSLKEVSGQIIDFLATSPLPDLFPTWTWGGIMFGTGIFAFLVWAVVVWLIP